MRIVGRKEFLSIPTPFMYIKCDKWGNPQSDLSVNCGTTDNKVDWVLNSCVFEPEYKDSGERFDRIDNMITDPSLDLPVIDMNTVRDGLYDAEQLFIVYSENDFRLFVNTMQKYLSVYGQNKDIDYVNE
jgi:hypothetical protein